jgi:hypothetical protein
VPTTATKSKRSAAPAKPKAVTTSRPKKSPKKSNSKIGLTLDISYRIIATFIASALGVIGAGSIIGLDVWMSAALGGLLAVARVIEKLSLAFLEDGKIDRKEVNMIFSQVVRLKEAGEDSNASKPKN